MENSNHTSLIVISNDNSSHLININKDTKIGEFYQQIILQFPNLNNMKLFYYEGYSHNKLYVSNEQEYITANKKCIEYFYLCSDEENDKIDYLKYHSVIIFSPIKLLNKQENNEKRKSMQMDNSSLTLNKAKTFNNSINNTNSQFNNMSGCNNVMNNNMMGNNIMMNNFNFPMNNMQNMGMNNMNNMMMNNNMMFNPFMNNMMMNNNMFNFNMNMNNFNNIKIFLDQLNYFQNSNPCMFYNYISQLNPQFLKNCYNIMMMNNYNNYNNYNANLQQQNNFQLKPSISQDNIQSEIIIPEYETIDTESNPMNKYIENAINFSYSIKHELLEEKRLHPNRFINIDTILSSPGLLSNSQPSKNDYKYILCLIGKILKNKDIEVGIYNDSQNKDRIDLCSIQFIFSGLINKKKYTVGILPNNDDTFMIIHDLTQRKKFIEEWKTKFSSRLKINKNLIILTNPRIRNDNIYIDLAFNPNIKKIEEKILEKELKKEGIIDFFSRPLLEGCRLSQNIFNPKYNKYYNQILKHQKRGGEEYIQPLEWTVYGMNVSGKYDFGNNTWLGNNNSIGEFAVAYYGINNLVNKNMNMMNNIMSLMGNLETGQTFVGVKNIRKQGHSCKAGAYFYKNPKYAENSSEIIKIAGFEYKVMFMCRVKPSKIMQPENFKDCWILSPTPDEVRPYKILIKKIPKSPLAIQSMSVIKMCRDPLPPPIYFQILNEKNESFYQKKVNNFPNLTDFDYVLKLYSQASTINSFLRNPQNPSIDNKSNVWCLHKAITQNINNVPNGTLVYRGVCFKLPNDLGIGQKFYFPEFLSTSTDIKIAQDIAHSGTLMYISIQNNGVNGKKIYCRNIEYISDYPFQKEILFTAYCQFRITKIEKTPNLDYLYLTCEGHNF